MTDTLTREIVDKVTYETVEVSPDDVETIMDRVTKVNRRAQREGLGPNAFTMTVDLQDREDTSRTGIVETVAIVTVYGQPVKIDGWTFVATLTWDAEAGLITRTLPGSPEDLDLSQFRSREAWCDHCQKVRNRNDTYALMHDNGRLIQVGSSCLVAFLGLKPCLWALSANLFDGLSEGCARSERRWTTDHVLATALAASQQWGWLSKAKAEYEGGCPTSNHVHSLLSGIVPKVYRPADREYREQWLAASHRVDEIMTDGTRIEQVREAVESMTPGREYVDNLQSAISASSVSARNVSLVASAVAVLANVERRAAATKAISGPLMGGPKLQPLGLVVRVHAIHEIESMYGVSYLISMIVESAKDPENVGRMVKWFASRHQGLAKDDKIRIVGGSVKGPDVYNGFESTKILRVKWEPAK